MVKDYFFSRKAVRLALGALGLSAVAIAVCWLGGTADGDNDGVASASVATSEKVLNRAHQPSTVPTRSSKSRNRIGRDVSGGGADEDSEEAMRSPEERKLAADIEKALDDEDFVLAKKCASLALVCKDTEIRQSMVDALGWFGKDALPELTSFLADADEDVRGSACCEWSSAVSDIEDEREKVSVVEMAMGVISDEDFLEDISSEYIGVDEKIAVESLMRVIADGKSEQGVAKAKETYEFVTSGEWQGADEARRWLAEEYEPPEN